MDRSSIAILCLALAAACTTARTITSADTVVVPTPRQYDCALEQAVAAEYDTLPSHVKLMLDDYKSLRNELAAAGKFSLQCVK